MRSRSFSERAVLLESLTPAAEVGAREWKAERSMLIEDRATRRKRIVVRVISIALWTWIVVAFFQAVFL